MEWMEWNISLKLAEEAFFHLTVDQSQECSDLSGGKSIDEYRIDYLKIDSTKYIESCSPRTTLSSRRNNITIADYFEWSFAGIDRL